MKRIQPNAPKRQKRKPSLSKPYRSAFEEGIAKSLLAKNIPFTYEAKSLVYHSVQTYTPDFVLPSGLIVEAKGFFKPQDRRKHLLVKQQHPDVDIRFVFQNASTPLSKGSKTTYAKWCERHGFMFAEKDVPDSWITQSIVEEES
ncbi:MAG: hypothetical protein J0G29_02160 [Alphaproteobacteria bacterium]|nr:hypothetical protein [Alphaproteobacteria bacterium]OJV45207.1 MAG: hypothetical protein BGO28_00180 [Alphaproteobacteria bacterium 43-37]